MDTEKEERADRLTLVDRWRWFELDRPVFVRPGETIQIEGDVLLVQRLDGRISRCRRRPTDADSIR